MVPAVSLGERAWNALRASGGFVWTHGDGTATVHWNKGCKPTKELVEGLKRVRGDLLAFVAERHAERDRAWRRSVALPAVRFSRRPSPYLLSPKR